MLCQERSLDLLGRVYKDVLRNLATVLYEMRRTIRPLAWEDMNDLVTRMLRRVLDLVEYAK